jgi:hypothetical protein
MKKKIIEHRVTCINLAFISIPGKAAIHVYDITDIKGILLYGEYRMTNFTWNNQVKSAYGLGEIHVDEANQMIYVSDSSCGIIILDARFSGLFLDSSKTKERILSVINTSGASRFGLTIDEDLNIAYVGQLSSGIDVVKLGNPKLKLVYKDGDNYREVEKIAPLGLRSNENPQSYPHEIHIMAILPAGGSIGCQVICIGFYRKLC